MNLSWLGTLANFADAISGAGSALSGQSQDYDFEDFNKILDKLRKSKKKKEEAEPSKEEPDAVEEYKKRVGSITDMSDEEFKKYKERLQELRELSKEKPKFFERLYNAGMALQGVHVPNRSDERFASYLNQFGQLLNLKRQEASDIANLESEKAKAKILEESPLYNVAAQVYGNLLQQKGRREELIEKARQEALNRAFQQEQAAKKFEFDKGLLGQEAIIRLLAALLPEALKYYSSQNPKEFVEFLKGGSFKELQEKGLPKSSSPFEKAFGDITGLIQGVLGLIGLSSPAQQPQVPAPPPQPQPGVPSLKPPPQPQQTQPPPGWFEQYVLPRLQGLMGGKNKVPSAFQGIGRYSVGHPFL